MVLRRAAGQGTVMLDQWAPDLEAAVVNAPAEKRQLWSAVLTNLTGGGQATTTVYTKARRWWPRSGSLPAMRACQLRKHCLPCPCAWAPC